MKKITHGEFNNLLARTLADALRWNCTKVEMSSKHFGVLIQAFFSDGVLQSSCPIYKQWPGGRWKRVKKLRLQITQEG